METPQVCRMNKFPPFRSNEQIPEHAAAFVAILRLACDRIERGESVREVVQAMALDQVARAVSGRV